MARQLFVITFLFSFSFSIAFAQPKGKKKVEEKPPTQKEMEDMMKEAQKELDNLDPEDKKMMDSLGFKMPDMKTMKKNMSGITDAQLKTAWEDENRLVPKKDDSRIGAIPKAALTASTIGSFISEMHSKTSALLKTASKTLGEKIFAQLKAEGATATSIGNAAAVLWIMGRIQPALYMMGKACADDITNTDNLNNYASMLSMSNAEQMAIPVLNYLNKKFPGNSTILNNLGQAWFGLGDIAKAEKYVDSTIRLYAYHPQANNTKSLIQENKGDHTGATESLKNSMQHSYTKEKEDRLRKLGYRLSSKDVTLPSKTNADPLNLGGSNPPAFPKSVNECIAMEPEWANYRAELKAKAASLKQQLEEAWNNTTTMQEKRNNENINMINASIKLGSPQGNLTLVPIYADRAYPMQKDVMDMYERKTRDWSQKSTLFITGRGFQLTNEYDAEIEKLQEADEEQTGEGKPNKDFCPLFKDVTDKYLKAYNSAVEPLFKERLDMVKVFLNDLTYWQLYSEWPEKFEAHKLEAKINWLGTLSCEPPTTFRSITKYKCAPKALAKPGKLSEFDDVACQYHSETNFIFAKMKSDCSRFTTEVDAKFIKLGLKQDMDKETFADQFVSCTVEVKAKIGGDKVNIGPVVVGAKAEAGMGVEIDRGGVKDVYLIGGVKAQAGALDTKFGKSAGFEGKISLVSGQSSVYGTGIFKGAK